MAERRREQRTAHSSAGKVSCCRTSPSGFEFSTWALVLVFFGFISRFNQHYSYSGKGHVRRHRDVSGNFVNLETLSTQSFRGAHKGRVCTFVRRGGYACVCNA
jgi:hypothetical protein